MLKLILAVSEDDFLARSLHDDMTWTGQQDKALFRLLTSVGGVCGIGTRSAKMVKSLPGRTLIPLSRQALPVNVVERLFGDSGTQPMTLESFASRYPGGWLLGGPTVAMAALEKELVDEVYLCRNPEILCERGEPFPSGIMDMVTPFLMRRGETDNKGIPWSLDQRIPFGRVTVDVWKRIDVVSRRPQS